MMICNVCGGTGFENLEQIPDGSINADNMPESVQTWIAAQTVPHDVCMCNCCGDGDVWYGEPGWHYGSDDPMGPDGPYANNGGLCKCH